MATPSRTKATPSRTKSGGSGCKPYFDLFCCKIYCSSNQIAERLITTFQLRSHAHTLKRVMEITAIAQTAANELGYRQLKPEQADVIEAFVKGRDVFAVLPTGYGKSLCYGCLPLVCQFVSPWLFRSRRSSEAVLPLFAYSLFGADTCVCVYVYVYARSFVQCG